MKNTFPLFLPFALLLISRLDAQPFHPYNSYTVLGENLFTISNALPFLRIVPDARSSGMGDVGIATSADANAIHHNPSKLAFADKKFGLSASFMPGWLKEVVSNQHQYLAYLSGYTRIKDRHNIGFSLRLYNFGDIEFVDGSGRSLGKGEYKDTEIGVAYTYKLSKKFSVGIGGAFIRSSVLSGLTIEGTVINPAQAFVGDLSATYKQPFSLFGKQNEFTAGLAFRKIGSKFTYTNSVNKDFVPATLGLGLAWEMEMNNKNTIVLSTDFNKLLVPTPTPWKDNNGNYIPDYREKSAFGAIFSSFGDAPGGFSEEIKEITIGVGVEYWYDKMIALRTGYFHESFAKGGRKNLSVGLGFRYKFLGADLSRVFWPDDNNRFPVKDIMRFSILCNL